VADGLSLTVSLTEYCWPVPSSRFCAYSASSQRLVALLKSALSVSQTRSVHAASSGAAMLETV
jgi:hypothetical protein